MATREKKLSVGRKQSAASPLPPQHKEDVTAPETPTSVAATAAASSVADEAPQSTTPTKSPQTRTSPKTKPIRKIANKKSAPITIRIKPNKLKKTVKVNQKVVKAIMTNPKNAEVKKKLLKTCKPARPRKSAKVPAAAKIEPKIEGAEEDQLPVLEPIFPIEENVDKSPSKKRASTNKTPKIDHFKNKIEGSVGGVAEDGALLIDNNQTKPKRVNKRRLKPETVTVTVTTNPIETIEEVMNDLTTLIKGEIIEETDSLSETSNKLEVKPAAKKIAVKRKRKENIENLNKLTPSERDSVIDMLDLNVQKIKTQLPTTKRRHSIEKFPIGSLDSESGINNFFTSISRSGSPRAKTIPRIRQTIDCLSKRPNPYKTRSDSASRILRNGKHRKLKDGGLLKGLEIETKKRKRNYSDFSGSEMSAVSKLSGYESDSSFSDLSSLHGADNSESKDSEAVKTEKDQFEYDPQILSGAVIKRSVSSEVDNPNVTDTNSNLCQTAVKAIKEEEGVEESATLKEPEKTFILDVMKQKFNTVVEDKSVQDNPPPLLSESPPELKPEPQIPPLEECPAVNPDNDVNVTNGVDKELVDVPPQLEPAVEIPEEKLESKEVEGEVNGEVNQIEETPENLAIKENILQALGLQSLKAAKEARLKNRDKPPPRLDNNYTGTLKTVIKINRDKKKGRNSMKMSLQKQRVPPKGASDGEIDDVHNKTKDAPSTSWNKHHGAQSSDTAGAHRKSHYSNRSNMDGSSEHTSDGELGSQEIPAKALVIPEKASSFSIHPERLCKDECSYCYGKFGLFDTPCHIAQMKSVERQNKILATEKHLTRDSCLCDACYRHVDRKSNTPSYSNRSYKRSALVAPGPRQDHCHVLGCERIASNILRRKWIIKMRKSVCDVINIDLDNPGLHSIPICDEHYSMLEHLMVCAMCKRRLAKNHVHYIGPEVTEINAALQNAGIPLTLSDKPVVCKLCKYFAAVVLKPRTERPENSSSFFADYKKRLLHFNDIVPMDEAAAEEPITVPTKEKSLESHTSKKKKRSAGGGKMGGVLGGDAGSDSQEAEKSDQSRVPSSESACQSRPDSPSDYMVDYNTLIPSIAMECGSDTEMPVKKDNHKSKKLSRPESVKHAVEISKKLRNCSDKMSDIAVQRLGSNPSISVRQLFPCEEDLPLQGNVEFGNVKERTPEGWEKCCSTIQYDLETKHLWNELQKPYGNQSSFLRHLILLEKYFRNGDLILAPNASHHSMNYSESVHNRLRAYDNIPTTIGNIQPMTMIPFNRPQKSSSGIITSSNGVKDSGPPMINAANIPKNTPITISQLNSPTLLQVSSVSPPKSGKAIGAPPGLISLLPGTTRPAPFNNKPAQSQKIKFPITKNWRPNLIPIDPHNKNPERKAGLVQVISGGRPYHITLEDYKKMCAIKKSFEQKQKRLQDKSRNSGARSVLKQLGPRKDLVISKAPSPGKNESIPNVSSLSCGGNSSSLEETSLEKLDRQVEKLEAKFKETALNLPKIPKSLTVIPQTVPRKPSRPSSPILMITQKPKQNKS